MKRSGPNKLCALILLLVSAFGVDAQQTGIVNYPYLGIRFTIPENWKGQEIEEAFLLGSDSEPGLIIIAMHEATTMAELREAAKMGLDYGGGTAFQLGSELLPIGRAGIGGTFNGSFEGRVATAYIAAILNPFGNGVMVFAVTTPESFSDRHKTLAEAIINSLQFKEPQETPLAREWFELLKGAKLTYLSSYSDTGYNSYGGSSTQEGIVLCSDGSFAYSYESSVSVSSDAGSAFGSNNDGGSGTWTVTASSEAATQLVLKFSDGRVFDYEISKSDGKTYLNDSRYFRTYDHGRCN